MGRRKSQGCQKRLRQKYALSVARDPPLILQFPIAAPRSVDASQNKIGLGDGFFRLAAPFDP